MNKKTNFWKVIFLLFPILIIGIFGYTAFADDHASIGKKDVVAVIQEPKPELDRMKVSTGAVMINPVKQQLIGVKKYPVQEKKLIKIIRTVGRVEYDERLLSEVNLKVEGWVEQLYADYTGKYVRKGEPLFKLYSPELLNAQEEYLLTTSGRSDSRLKTFAKTRLKFWDISESQIKKLENTRKPMTLLQILAPTSGYITSKSIVEGSHIKPGQTLIQIADIKKIWILGDIYENELPFIQLGQKVTVSLQSMPGHNLQGDITYIYPSLDPQTRSVKFRIEVENPKEIFKPGMFTNIQISVDTGTHLAVPESAVLNSGVRQIVFVSKGNGMFAPVEVTAGPLANGYYPIEKGLQEGQVVVRSANFFLDSESKLMASSSGMMGLVGMGDWKMEHSKMGEMDMSGMKGMEGMKDMDMSGMKGMKNKEGMQMEGKNDSKTQETLKVQKHSKTDGETE